MDDPNDFIDEMRKFTYGVNVLPTRIANALEREQKIEVGTKQSFEAVKYVLEVYIEQTEAAIQLLDKEEHTAPIMRLKESIKIYQETIAGVQRQLDEGDFLPKNSG